MLKKRFASLALAGVMAASLAIPAFAEETKVTATYADVPISVVVPATGTATINPYGLPFDVEKSDHSKLQITGEQICTQPLALKNQGATDLDVTATVTGAVKKTSDLELVTTAPASTVTDKQAFVYLEVGAGASLIGADDTTLADAIVTACADAAGTTWATYAANQAKFLVVNPDEPASTPSGQKMTTLKAATLYAASDSETQGANPTKQVGDFKSYAANSVAPFRLSGECVTSPESAWTTKDSFDVTIAFTFIPA